MTTTIETAGAGGHAAAVTTDTGRAARLTIAAADVQRVLESLVDGCMEEEEAGAARMKDTSRDPGESPESDPAPDPHLHERTSNRRPPPATLRKKCDRRIPRPAPGPGLRRDHTLAHVLGPGPGPGARQEDAKAEPTPHSGPPVLSDRAELVVLLSKGVCLP